jgi:hypothetical protein
MIGVDHMKVYYKTIALIFVSLVQQLSPVDCWTRRVHRSGLPEHFGYTAPMCRMYSTSQGLRGIDHKTNVQEYLGK